MILYVNGDSHTAAAECVNKHAFAEDDGTLWPTGREPHPDNLSVSWGKLLADSLHYDFVCGAESASSNDRIMRTTKNYIQNNKPDLIVIQWSTWEREEWFIHNKWYQVNASGIDIVPKGLKKDYKNYIANIDWTQKTLDAHLKIFNFHLWLQTRNIRHLFFNGNNTFDSILNRVDWNNCYYKPYYSSFDLELADKFEKRNGGYHYGPEAHTHWANTLYQYLVDNHLV